MIKPKELEVANELAKVVRASSPLRDVAVDLLQDDDKWHTLAVQLAALAVAANDIKDKESGEAAVAIASFLVRAVAASRIVHEQAVNPEPNRN